MRREFGIAVVVLLAMGVGVACSNDDSGPANASGGRAQTTDREAAGGVLQGAASTTSGAAGSAVVMGGATDGGRGGADGGSGGTSMQPQGGAATTVNGGAAGSASGAAGSAGDTTPPADTIFTSVDMPRCTYEGDMQHQLRGVLNGERIDVRAPAMASDLIGARFRTFVFDSNQLIYPLELTWSESPREDRPIPISGGRLLVRDGALAGQAFCITQGEFGSRSAQLQEDARELLFRITSVRAGDCTGEDLPVQLLGCIMRSGSYFPDRLTVDFPVDSKRPTLDPTKTLVSLTDTERAELCDWVASMLGGYGAVTDCRPDGGSSVSGYRDREQCLAGMFYKVCPRVTVEDQIRCTVATAPKRGCEYPSEACFDVAGLCG